jgi:hypothetical protein
VLRSGGALLERRLRKRRIVRAPARGPGADAPVVRQRQRVSVTTPSHSEVDEEQCAKHPGRGGHEPPDTLQAPKAERVNGGHRQGFSATVAVEWSMIGNAGQGIASALNARATPDSEPHAIPAPAGAAEMSLELALVCAASPRDRRHRQLAARRGLPQEAAARGSGGWQARTISAEATPQLWPRGVAQP